MELEALFLGLEPMTALVIGIGAVILAPVIGAVGVLGKDSAAVESVAESTRDIAKTGLIWGLDIVDKTQSFFAEAGETFQDLVAEAVAERNATKANTESRVPHEVSLK